MTIKVSPLDSPPVRTLPFEMVERKGVGHPDTICDAVAEAVSGALTRSYVERFGSVLHHNVDKALLCGGAARPAFGGGEVVEPIEIHIAGRATKEYRGITIAVDEVAIDSSRRWLREHLPALDCDRDVRIIPHIRPTSPDLTSLFNRGDSPGQRLANDTSFGVGFAPLDTLERMVMAVESALTEPGTRRRHPWTGADVKVMGARHGDEHAITVACALVGAHIADLGDYFRKKAIVRDLAASAARQIAQVPLMVVVNAADHDSADSIYLTVTGLSAESGDDGQVGRGNRVNGLITPYRPMSLEAAAGKNPVTHVGKLYNVMATRVARAVVTEIPEVADCYCYLLSCIGRPIAEPQLFEIKVAVETPQQLNTLMPKIRGIAHDAFSGIDSLWRESMAGTLQLW